jgi:hypothetical protein
MLFSIDGGMANLALDVFKFSRVLLHGVGLLLIVVLAVVRQTARGDGGVETSVNRMARIIKAAIASQFVEHLA